MPEQESRDELHDPLTDALGAEQRELDHAARSADVGVIADEAGLLDEVFAQVGGESEGRDTPAPTQPVSLSQRRTALAWAVPLVAVAAALLAWLVVRPSGAVAPPYQLVSVQAGRAEVRGTDVAEQIRLRPRDALTLTLAPDGEVTTPVALAVVARDASGKGVARRPSSGVQVDASGSVRVESTLAGLASVEPGAYVLEFWVGPRDALPQTGDVVSATRESSVAVITLPILVPSTD